MKRSVEKAARRGAWGRQLRAYGPGALLYALVTLATGAYFPGDTSYYVGAVVRARATGDFLHWDEGAVHSFWEFGHLLWRPAGWLAHRLAAPLLAPFFGGDARAEAAFVFLAINWLSGLACVVLLAKLLGERFGRSRATDALVAAFVLTLGFLNYAQTGCSYVPGLAFLLAGLGLTLKAGAEDSPRASLLAGLAYALAVGAWLLYALVLPALLAAPLLLDGVSRARLRRCSEAALACAAAGALMYGAVLLALGLYTPAEAAQWARAAGHGLERNAGVPQFVFGLARSFVHMGNDGVLFRRYLLGDPYNAVSLADLFRLSLWKLSLFYLFAAALGWRLLRDRDGRRHLLLVAAAALPVLALALLWQGTTMERYMPLYPALFLAARRSLAGAPRWYRGLALATGLALAASNLTASSAFKLSRERAAQLARVEGLRARLRPADALLVGQDPLAEQTLNSALDEELRGLPVHSFLSLGMPETTAWRQNFAAKSLGAWRAGGDVWVSRRLFADRPRADWNWVEGADPRVRWAELPAFFKQLETGETAGGEDGFTLLPRTPRNESILAAAAGGKVEDGPGGARARREAMTAGDRRRAGFEGGRMKLNVFAAGRAGRAPAARRQREGMRS